MPSKGALLRNLLKGDGSLVAPGVFNPILAKLAERIGFKAVYLSGAAFANSLGLPDLGITTQLEVTEDARRIVGSVNVPLIVDIDTGFGGAFNIARTVREMENAGVAAVHIEDQAAPKRCGHLEGKRIVRVEEMVERILAAKEAIRDDLMLIARTDARALEGLEGAIERARTYRRAGAEMIFPEALESKEEFEEFSRKVGGLLLANMTEFGKTPYMTAREFKEMGYNIVIFPVTTFRVMLKSVRDTLVTLLKEGTQEGILDKMMTRDDINDVLEYSSYEESERRLLGKLT